jgi:hypothetical protein
MSLKLGEMLQIMMRMIFVLAEKNPPRGFRVREIASKLKGPDDIQNRSKIRKRGEIR